MATKQDMLYNRVYWIIILDFLKTKVYFTTSSTYLSTAGFHSKLLILPN